MLSAKKFIACIIEETKLVAILNIILEENLNPFFFDAKKWITGLLLMSGDDASDLPSTNSYVPIRCLKIGNSLEMLLESTVN